MIVTHISYLFLSLLPVTESLSVRGQRLNETAKERQNKVYAPDTNPSVEVVSRDTRLVVDKFDNHSPIVYHGEHRRILARLVNSGKTEINEIWLVPSRQDRICLLVPGHTEKGNALYTPECPDFMQKRWCFR